MHWKMKSSFIKTHNVSNETTCLCGAAECSSLTAAFRDLQDARKRFIQIPPHQPNGDNALRECYLRHVAPHHCHRQDLPTNYIALHHFYPIFIQEYHYKIPKTVSLGQAIQLKMKFEIQDKVTDEYGMPAIFNCPTYPRGAVQQDLKTPVIPEASSSRSSQQEPTLDKASSLESSVPDYVAIEEDEMSDVSSIDYEDDNGDSEKAVADTKAEAHKEVDRKEGKSVEYTKKEPEAEAQEEDRKEAISVQPTKMDTVMEDKATRETAQTVMSTSGNADTNNTLNTTTFYSLDELRAGVDGVEFTKREQYLSPEDFESTFGMSKEEFNELRKWKQQLLKKKVGLF